DTGEITEEMTRSALTGIPARDPHAAAGLVDLSHFYNAALTDSWHDPPGKSGNTLAALPRGLVSLGGVQFDVRGIVQLYGPGLEKNRPGAYPRRMDGIPIRRKLKRLQILHATGWGVGEGTEIAQFVIHYADGQS